MKKNISKWVALTLAGAMACGLMGCGSGDNAASTAKSTSEKSASATSTPAAGSSSSSASSASSASASSGTSGELIKVGVTFGDLANPVWADCANHMMEVDESYGFDVTAVGCDSSDEQIDQVENFITSGCKAIVVGAKDTDSMGDYMKQVIDEGIVVFALGYEISNYTADMMVRNYDVGYSVASMAAEWINEKFPDGCEVLINDAPEYDVLVDRVSGMEAALKDLAPKAKIVSYISGTTTAEILPQAENAMTANPNIKVCVTIGDGGALACKEAANGMGLNTDDFAIFGVDCTEQVAKAIYQGAAIRGAMSLGGGKLHGETILDVLQKIFADEDYPKNTPYPETQVTKENVAEVAEQMGFSIE